MRLTSPAEVKSGSVEGGSLELSRPVPPVWELIVAELHSPVHTDHLCLKTTLRARTQHRYSPILDRLSPHRRGHRLATLPPARSSLVHHLTRGRTDLHFLILNFQTNHRRRDSIHRTLRRHVTVLRTSAPASFAKTCAPQDQTKAYYEHTSHQTTRSLGAGGRTGALPQHDGERSASGASMAS